MFIYRRRLPLPKAMFFPLALPPVRTRLKMPAIETGLHHACVLCLAPSCVLLGRSISTAQQQIPGPKFMTRQTF